jgi:hypothetical protein
MYRDVFWLLITVNKKKILLCSPPPNLLLANDHVPTFRKICYSFRVPLLFSPWMARVTSSKEGIRCPRMDCFNLWNKWKSGRLMSGLYGAWCNTSHSYLLSKSVTTFPRCGRVMSCKMSGPSPSKSGRLCAFFCAIFATSRDNKLLSRLFHRSAYFCIRMWRRSNNANIRFKYLDEIWNFGAKICLTK